MRWIPAIAILLLLAAFDAAHATQTEIVRPRINIDELKKLQQSVDEGHQPWRLDPVSVACSELLFPVSTEPCYTNSRVESPSDTEAIVTFRSVSNDYAVYLKRLVRLDGIWTATRIETTPAAPYAVDLPAELRIVHSLRFRHHTITIDFIEREGVVTATVKTKHSQADVVPEIDNTYTFTSGQAQTLRRLFSRLDLSQLRSAVDKVGLGGLDGQNWFITYRDESGGLITLKRWSPDSLAEERGLEDYVALFKFALDAVGFDPEKTMPKGQ